MLDCRYDSFVCRAVADNTDFIFTVQRHNRSREQELIQEAPGIHRVTSDENISTTVSYIMQSGPLGIINDFQWVHGVWYFYCVRFVLFSDQRYG